MGIVSRSPFDVSVLRTIGSFSYFTNHIREAILSDILLVIKPIILINGQQVRRDGDGHITNLIHNTTIKVILYIMYIFFPIHVGISEKFHKSRTLSEIK